MNAVNRLNEMRNKVLPLNGKTLLDADRPYVNAAKTNVQDTWRKFGWVPPSESKPTTRETT
jgi:hypothetical protein